MNILIFTINERFLAHSLVEQWSYRTNNAWYYHREPERSIPGGGVLPYIGYIGICRCEGYGFQAVYSRIAYINQSVWV